jgi:hypothetical protein
MDRVQMQTNLWNWRITEISNWTVTRRPARIVVMPRVSLFTADGGLINDTIILNGSCKMNVSCIRRKLKSNVTPHDRHYLCRLYLVFINSTKYCIAIWTLGTRLASTIEVGSSRQPSGSFFILLTVLILVVAHLARMPCGCYDPEKSHQAYRVLWPESSGRSDRVALSAWICICLIWYNIVTRATWLLS